MTKLYKITSNIYSKQGTDLDAILEQVKLDASEIKTDFELLPKHTCDEKECYVDISQLGSSPYDIEECIAFVKENADKLDWENKIYIVTAAIGAGEVWGFNTNGDYVSESELCRDNAYKTFENALVFVEHDNKAPHKAVGKVLKAVYDHQMKRVVLLLEIDPNVAPSEAIEDIKNGYTVAVSMGMNPAYDKCSICGNLAASVKDYCEHLRPVIYCKVCGAQTSDPQKVCEHIKKDVSNRVLYRPGILEYDEATGKIIGMINYGVKFHDISLVANPAEKDAVAVFRIDSPNKAVMLTYKFGQGRRAMYQARTNPQTTKNANEVNEIGPSPNAIRLVILSEPVLPDEILEKMQLFNPREVLSTLSACGILLRPHEFNVLKPSCTVGVKDYRQYFNNIILKLIAPFIALRSIFDDFAMPRIKAIIIRDECVLEPDETICDECTEQYDQILDGQYQIIKDIIRTKKTPALNVLQEVYNNINSDIRKEAGAVGTALGVGLAGAIAPHLYAGYKITTAKQPTDIDWLTQKIYENPLGASLWGTGTFLAGGLGLKMLKHRFFPKIAHVVEPFDSEIKSESNIWEELNKKAADIIKKLQ